MESNSKLLLHSDAAMPKICNSCAHDINSNESYIGCNGCFLWYHINCKVKNRAGVTKISKMAAWFCSTKCEDEYNKISSLKSVVEPFELPENPSIKDLCKILIQHIEKSKLDSINTQQACAEQKNYNNKELQYLKHEVNVLKQQQLQNCVLVSGVPLKNDIDVVKVIANINTVIKSAANLNNIFVEKKEIQSFNQQKQYLLRVDFCHQYNKHLFMDALKSHGPLSLRQIFEHEKEGRIYIRDELTPFYNKLSFECRKVKKEFDYKFCWFKNGKVMLKKAEKSKIYSFKSFLDLENFVIKLNKIKNNINDSNYDDASSSGNFD
jgi:hypothetical protein